MLVNSHIKTLLIILFIVLSPRSFSKSEITAQMCYQNKDLECLKTLQNETINSQTPASSKNHEYAYYLGLLYLENGDNADKAKEHLMIALIFNKHPQAKNKLKEIYEKELVEFDATECLAIESKHCLKNLADEKNDSAAQYLLGNTLREEDPITAVKYLEKATLQGNKTAPCILAIGTRDKTLPTQQTYHDATQYVMDNCFFDNPFKNLNKKHFEKYSTKKMHKAFAYSPSGYSYFHHDFTAESYAVKAALVNCNFHNKAKDQPCKIINVNDQWVDHIKNAEALSNVNGANSLITNKAKKYYEKTYSPLKKNKVFAQSDLGTWAARTSSTETIEALKEKALKACSASNSKHQKTYPCRVINLNGKWL